MKRFAIFASGNGTNAENIIRHFKQIGQPDACAMVVTNRADAGVVQRARQEDVPVVILTKADMQDCEKVLDILHSRHVELIVLAGYLLLLPAYLVNEYHNRIINIHPALLPAHSGKGMFGHHVHEDVIRCGDTESGITIHYVTERFDDGETIFTATCPVLPDDNAVSLEAKIHHLEYTHFPRVVESLLNDLDN